MKEGLTNKERSDLFLTTFRQLESKMISLARISSSGHVAFSKALSEVYYQHLDPIVSDYDNYDFLKTAAELRNILSHENNACYPSTSFLNHFLEITNAILKPLTCLEIATKDIRGCFLFTPLLEALRLMDKYYLSHLPVFYEEGKVIGVFSRSTLFDFLLHHHEIKKIEDLKIEDFKEYLPIERHSNETFLFVAKKESVTKVFSSLYNRDSNHKKVALLFVTETGSKQETLLGVIATADLAKYK